MSRLLVPHWIGQSVTAVRDRVCVIGWCDKTALGHRPASGPHVHRGRSCALVGR